MTPKARNPLLLAPRYLLRAVSFAMRGGSENPVSSLSVAQLDLQRIQHPEVEGKAFFKSVVMQTAMR